MKASVDAGSWFKLSRVMQAALLVTPTTPTERDVIDTLILRQYAVRRPRAVSDTNRYTLSKFIEARGKNTLSRALKALIERRIVLIDGDNPRADRLFLNTRLDQWEGMNRDALEDVLSELGLSRVPEIGANSDEERGEEVPFSGEEIPNNGDELPPNGDELPQNGANSTGLRGDEREKSPLPPLSGGQESSLGLEAPSSPKDSPPWEAAKFADAIPEGDSAGQVQSRKRGEKRASRRSASRPENADGWLVKAAIGWLIAENGWSEDEIRAVKALAATIRRKELIDPERWANAVDGIAIQKRLGRINDPRGALNAAYYRGSWPPINPGYLLKRWLGWRSDLDAGADVSAILEAEGRAKLDAAKEAAQQAKDAAAETKAAEEALRIANVERWENERTAKRQAYAEAAKDLENVLDGDLTDYGALVVREPWRERYLGDWLANGRQRPDDSALTFLNPVLQGFIFDDLEAAREAEVAKEALADEIAPLLSAWRAFDANAVRQRAESMALPAGAVSALHLAALRKWNLHGLKREALESLRDALSGGEGQAA